VSFLIPNYKPTQLPKSLNVWLIDIPDFRTNQACVL
jgi:hypothetical protein